MITLPGYKIKERIYESENSIIFKATGDENNQPVVIKILNNDYPSPEQIIRFKKSFFGRASNF